MATSGIYTFTQNRDQIIRRAARLVNAIAAGETPDANITSVFSDALNSMVKNWMAQGLHLWAEQEGILLLQPGQNRYDLGATSTDQCAPWPIHQTTCTSAPAGAVHLVVGSTTGMLEADRIGVVMSTGMVFWSTLLTTPTTATIEMTTPLTTGVTAGAFVFSYPVKIQRPLRILGARRYIWPAATETPLKSMSTQDYMDLTNKETRGNITQYHYFPRLDLGQLYVWPTPIDWTSSIRFTAMRPLQDFTAAGDNPDFPQEWIDPLVFNLAHVMAVEYAVNPEQYAMIKELAMDKLETAKGFDREPESIFIGVNLDYR